VVAMSKPVYVIRAERWKDWWALVVPELSGVASQSRRLDQAEKVIQEVIELLYDKTPDSYELRLEVDPAIAEVADHVKAAQAEADRAVAAARVALRSAIARFRELDMPQRDVGALLGLSHQRVAQLEGAPAKRTIRVNGPSRERVAQRRRERLEAKKAERVPDGSTEAKV
jgi:hypothetical protein